ncbi:MULTISPECIES: helix-turn-helix domain-containing protein [unclassified Microbacterium]|uniref:AraC family transcriptional regulator n=1 Tax=unclassified Microbacterium TaxID=2609290 RepID=UPI00365922B0
MRREPTATEGGPLESIPIRAPELRQIIGRQRASAPDWDAFHARSRERRYGGLRIERFAITQVRLASTPTIRRDAVLIAYYHVVAGRFTVSRDGRSFTVAPGESVLMLSTGGYQYHIEDGEYLQALVPLQAFDPLEIADVLDAIDLPLQPDAVSRATWALLIALLDDPDDDPSDEVVASASESAAAAAITQVAAVAISKQVSAGRRSSILSAAFLYINGHVSDITVDLAAMASALGTSSRTLHREFQAIGTTPMAALRDARLTAAAQRLASRAPLASLDELARDCGYSDRTSLTRAFRRRYGRSPAEYRTRATSVGPGAL